MKNIKDGLELKNLKLGGALIINYSKKLSHAGKNSLFINYIYLKSLLSEGVNNQLEINIMN